MDILKIIFHAAALACKTPGVLFGFFHQRRIAAKQFRRELLYAGMEPWQADELTACYRTIVVPEWNDWLKQGIKGHLRK